MPEIKIDTGLGGLDSDLQLFFEFCESDRLQRINEALAAKTLSKKLLADLVSDGAFRLATGLGDPVTYGSVWEEANKEARPLIEQAKSLVDEKFTELLKHPLVAQRMQEMLRSEAGNDESPLADRFNTISALHHFATWFGTPPRLIPGVRVAFLNQQNKVLLDTPLRWNDLLFVAAALLETAADGMERGKGLADLEQVDLAFTDSFMSRFKEIEECLCKIRKSAPHYGMHLESSGNSQTKEASGKDKGDEKEE